MGIKIESGTWTLPVAKERKKPNNINTVKGNFKPPTSSGNPDAIKTFKNKNMAKINRENLQIFNFLEISFKFEKDIFEKNKATPILKHKPMTRYISG